ncbi:MAG: PKD domain-containing protein [Candidatus Bipolaricaulia bacterium]
MKSRWLIAVILLSLIGLGGLSPAQQYAEVAVESKTVSPGGTTTIAISVKNVPEPGLADIQGSLSFDPAVVQVNKVSGLNDYEVFAADIDNDVGEVQFVVAQVTGKHIRAGGFLQFEVKAIGKSGESSPLMLTLDVFRDADGHDIDYSITNGTLSIGGGNTPPKAKFTFSPASPKAGEEIQFTDQSTDPDGTIQSWSWDFGDGATSTERNPTHKYSAKGKYTVKLTVTDNGGLKNTATKTLAVGIKPPIANFAFTPASPRVGQTVQFTDQSTDPDGTIQSWSWDFGDGATSTERNPKHHYAQKGTYTVKLTVTDNDGLTDTATEQINIGAGRPTVLVHCFPNPASTETTFTYDLPAGTAKATLYLFDITGRLVFHRDVTGSEYTWDLRSDGGVDLPNGPYFYYIVARDAQGKQVARSKIGKLVIQRS